MTLGGVVVSSLVEVGVTGVCVIVGVTLAWGGIGVAVRRLELEEV